MEFWKGFYTAVAVDVVSFGVPKLFTTAGGFYFIKMDSITLSSARRLVGIEGIFCDGDEV